MLISSPPFPGACAQDEEATAGCDGVKDTECTPCKLGYVGDNCKYAVRGHCSGHGNASATGVCTCDAGYSSVARCAYREDHCNNLGEILLNGSCACGADNLRGAKCQCVVAAK